MKSSYIGFVLRLFIGSYFIWAAHSKIIDPGDFAKSINNYLLVPNDLVNVLAIFLPWLEILAGIFIILPTRYREPSTLLITLMLIVFTLAITSAVVRGIDINCGCTTKDVKVGWKKVAENSGLILTCFVAWSLLKVENRFEKVM